MTNKKQHITKHRISSRPKKLHKCTKKKQSKVVPTQWVFGGIPMNKFQIDKIIVLKIDQRDNKKMAAWNVYDQFTEFY